MTVSHLGEQNNFISLSGVKTTQIIRQEAIRQMAVMRFFHNMLNCGARNIRYSACQTAIKPIRHAMHSFTDLISPASGVIPRPARHAP